VVISGRILDVIFVTKVNKLGRLGGCYFALSEDEMEIDKADRQKE
jgi:hypothetical protein